ncbi:uncharacterized protein LOC114533525 [Dendronephthya gigantea]|uniref:uncharacterized protein LOC114533525 n=1 Tax=Dendronephthya gigantea TaxID=151771 RepID=UPI00106C2C39|nr:uncharacterized protein LOC114533525 [Dendronephthya gigantea]
MEKAKKTKSASRQWPGQKEFQQAQLLEFIHHDYESARRYYEKACKVGNPFAQYQYGLWFMDDKGERIKPDDVKARRLFEASAENGHGVAQVALAQLYETGRGGLKKDESKAFYWYKEAVKNPASIAKENIGKINNKIGMMYMEGVGTMKDVTKAIKWFKKAESYSSLPPPFQSLIETLAQINPGAPRQKEADKRWSVMSDYIDKLPQDEKPKTFGSWTKVMKKCGYGVHEQYILQTNENTPCNFPEFLELSGGSFQTLETYELQDVKEPKRKCGYCDKEEGDDVTLKLCSRCAQPYCSRICQKSDWRAHKPVCNAVHENL